MSIGAGLAVAVFLAATVGFIKAFTIVLAIGVSPGWRAAVAGIVAAFTVLAVATAAVGPALARWVPDTALQLVGGALLLVFGAQWLRKAVLRSLGLAAAATGAALALGVITYRPLFRIPENTLAFSVTLLLITFGTFWAVEGLGVFAPSGALTWLGGDRALMAVWIAGALISVQVLRTRVVVTCSSARRPTADAEPDL